MERMIHSWRLVDMVTLEDINYLDQLFNGVISLLQPNVVSQRPDHSWYQAGYSYQEEI